MYERGVSIVMIIILAIETFFYARNILRSFLLAKRATSSALSNCTRMSFSTDASSNATSLSCPMVERSLVLTKDSLEKNTLN